MPKSVDSTKIAEGYKSLLGTPLGRDISQHLQDENIVFVFPSQDTADSWARAVVYSEISRAVALNRFWVLIIFCYMWQRLMSKMIYRC